MILLHLGCMQMYDSLTQITFDYKEEAINNERIDEKETEKKCQQSQTSSQYRKLILNY